MPKRTLDSAKNLRKPSAGRPVGIMVRAEDADVLRRAVKSMTRYFGIRIQDLVEGSSAWIADAMRSGRPMSVETAEKLLSSLYRPHHASVGKKRPQGEPQSELFEAWRKDPSGTSVKRTATLEYLGYLGLASVTLNRYLSPIPGSAFFVLPGAARSIAEILVDELPLSQIGAARRRQFVEAIRFFFEKAEEPLKTELGKKLVPRLTVLGIINNLNAFSELQSTLGADALGLVEIAESLEHSENQRQKIVMAKAVKKTNLKKRRVLMPRIKDVL